MHLPRRLLALAALVVLSLAGCSDAGAEIEGDTWTVVGSSVSSSDLSGFDITAVFEDGTVGGRGGVNSYSAPYAVTRDGGLEIGTITQTEIAGPPDAMAAETAYFALLGEVGGYELEGDTLTLLDAEGNQLVIFER